MFIVAFLCGLIWIGAGLFCCAAHAWTKDLLYVVLITITMGVGAIVMLLAWIIRMVERLQFKGG